MTNDKFGAPQEKPRYNALLFLNKMKGVKLNTLGQGSWVKAFTELDGTTIRLLIVNYDPYGNHAEAVPIRIDKIKDGNYTVRRTDFGGGVRVRTTTVAGGVMDLTEGFTGNTAAIFEITPQ